MATVWIYPCDGALDDASERTLEVAFNNRDMAKVMRLYRTDDVPDERCWLRGSGWCVAYD